MSKEAMKLALEALENSIDLVSHEARNAEELYGKYPTRLARIQGLVAFEVAHEKAIAALRQALANEALDKMAENARELGLDYEPAQQEPVDWEAVAADQAMTIALLMAELQEFAERQADAVEVALTESGWVWDGDQWQRPPQTWAGLTDEEVKGCFDSVPTQDCQNYEHWRSLCARNIEAKLKEKNTP